MQEFILIQMSAPGAKKPVQIKSLVRQLAIYDRGGKIVSEVTTDPHTDKSLPAEQSGMFCLLDRLMRLNGVAMDPLSWKEFASLTF